MEKSSNFIWVELEYFLSSDSKHTFFWVELESGSRMLAKVFAKSKI
jgi:hypothetical protein